MVAIVAAVVAELVSIVTADKQPFAIVSRLHTAVFVLESYWPFVAFAGSVVAVGLESVAAAAEVASAVTAAAVAMGRLGLVLPADQQVLELVDHPERWLVADGVVAVSTAFVEPTLG